MGYYVDDSGNKVKYSKYISLGSLTLVDLFPNRKKVTKMLEFKEKKPLRAVYNRRNTAAVVRKIFFDFFELVINKLTEGGMLSIPTKSNAAMSVKKLSELGIHRYIKHGYITTGDAITANHEIPVFKYDFGPKSRKNDRYLFIPRHFAKKLMQNAVNNRIKYTYYTKRL